MSSIKWKEDDTARAIQFWTAYQESHDLSNCRGQVAGIDPSSGRVWLDETAKAIAKRRENEGLDSPLFFVRVGYDHHVRKGGHR